MKNVIFFCNWGCNSEKLLNTYKLFTPNNCGEWNNIKGTTELQKADIVVFLEDIPNNFNLNNLNNKKIICFPREPLNKKRYELMKSFNKYTYDNIIHVVTYPQFIDKTYDFLKSLNYNKPDKNFSAIISNKGFSPGHRLRKQFLIKLANTYPNICDIYGAGWHNELGISYKGQLGSYHNKNNNNIVTKYDGLINYNYSLCIENCSKKNYFTEKFTDAILCWTIPIYYGCTNISDYFPKDSYYYIDITKPDCITNIIEIINKPITLKNLKALEIARDLILNKYNIWNYIQQEI
jgi:hypothetical protein